MSGAGGEGQERRPPGTHLLGAGLAAQVLVRPRLPVWSLLGLLNLERAQQRHEAFLAGTSSILPWGRHSQAWPGASCLPFLWRGGKV